MIAVLGLRHGALAAPESGRGDAETLVKEGIELRRLGNDDGALKKFEAAFALEQTPRNAAQLGLCEQALGRWAAAERHLSLAIQAHSDPWVAKYRKVLRDSLEAAKEHVARVEFVGGPQGAQVLVNGEDAGTLPMSEPFKTGAGRVHLVVTAPGYDRWTSTLSLPGGHYQRVVVEMIPTVKPASAPVIRNEAFAASKPDDDGAVPALQKHDQDASEDSRISPWIWGGAAAAVVVVGVITALVLSSGGASSGACTSGVDICVNQN